MKNYKSSVAIVALSSFALLGANAAQADVLATSVLKLDNLTFYKSGTTDVITATDFTALFYTSSADVNASLNGTLVGSDDDTASAAAIDLAPACVGDCPAITDNAFPIITSTGGAPSAHFAASDQYQAGSPIAGLGVFLGANIQSAAYVSLLGESSGTSGANNELGSDFIFSGYSGGIAAAFDLTAYVEAFATADSIFPSKAAASFSIVFTITDANQTELFKYEFAETRSNTSPLSYGDAKVFATPGSIALGFDTGDIFDAGEIYTLSARTTVNADATMVPEPGMIALLGAGLLGLGFSRKRRDA
ncbi:MAG: PEP-CTERM sorting domain-containing protein [Pseudomonadales bacterium]|nr:PEP-CTERM sorting domain-containing protein [Pseudomonadales bacterium]